MLKSLHIGRYVGKVEELRALTKFLEAIGFRPVTTTDKRSALFSAPVGLLSINALPPEAPAELVEQLKDVNRLIVVEVSNPDDAFAIAEKQKLRVLIDTASPKSGERSFSLALPGDIVVTLYGRPEEPPAGIEGELKAAEHDLEQMARTLAGELAERVLGRRLNGGGTNN